MGEEILQGDAQDNVLFGARYNDFLDGGAGTDTALYLGNSEVFTIIFDARQLIRVMDNTKGSDH